MCRPHPLSVHMEAMFYTERQKYLLPLQYLRESCGTAHFVMVGEEITTPARTCARDAKSRLDELQIQLCTQLDNGLIEKRNAARLAFIK
eukprot:COSAG02_NODE_43073_length_378_cov_0.974910_1_plen_88_part_10